MDNEELHEMTVARLAVGGWFSRALAVAARLGIADILQEEPLPHTEIAERTGSNPDVLLRMMQVLVFCGVAQRDEHGAFEITPQFAQLRTDHPWSMRYTTMLFGETYDDAFSGLLHTVQTGKSGFNEVFGVSLYEHLENDPEAARVFDLAMFELAKPVAATLLRRYDFSEVNTVVDVGGGGGAMLVGILAENPHLKGIVADRETTCVRGTADLAASAHSALSDRISFVPSDFFEEVPAGGDRYILKNVLHDWTFESGQKILSTIGRAMTRTQQDGDVVPRLLVLEPLITNDFDATRELFQMVACEEGMFGQDVEGMRDLLDKAGFDVLSVDRLPTGHSVFECTVR
jgi:C-methyltransferase